ncbi:MAG: hypothetical protein BZ138_08070 [Methanosphaera sp. rholeuAM270]|nr:MAG: hypothetical protein BZ138_08070 [Methanosphaera sp. rholeuAM270]
MITEKQKIELKNYEGDYGIDCSTKILFRIMVENDLVKPTEMVGPILDILLNEDLPHFDDENVGAVLDIDYIESEPRLLRKIVDKNYEQYSYRVEGEMNV